MTASKMKTNEEYIINGMFVSYHYKDGELIDIGIQRQDGEVLFSGYPHEARELFEVLDTLAGEDSI